jgi:hydroxyisourate hydrolase
MTLEELNTMTRDRAIAALQRCCGSERWAHDMVDVRPFETAALLASTADRIWLSLDRSDWLEAFEAHPRIGDRMAVGSAAGGSDATDWSAEEQRGSVSATDEVLERLRVRNDEYRAQFGFTFIVCATGRSADEMLEMLEQRLQHEPQAELHVAAEEQRKIIRTRLQKLIDASEWVAARQQSITTHVLDTSRGGAAVGVAVILEMRHASDWVPIGRGDTDRSGRVTTLLEGRTITPGTYRLTFDIGTYFRAQGISTPFFPEAKVVFVIRDPAEHYHVPLLISPFGYSTYRGT